MTDDQTNKTTGSQPSEKTTDEVHGRINNTQNPAFEQVPSQNDISRVDQQEGNMNPGEAGLPQKGGQQDAGGNR